MTTSDRPWVVRTLTEHWLSPKSVSRGRVHDADRAPGFLAEHNGRPIGLVTYCIEGDQCEVLTLNSLCEGIGVGAALLEEVAGTARRAGCRRVWLITTNDNLPAIRFYQRRGWRLAAVHPKALEESRRLKPEIPLVGIDGIPLRDEIEFELEL